MEPSDRVDLPDDDFRRERRLLAPHCFADGDDEPDVPATELISQKAWEGIMALPTDVAVRTSSHQGRTVERLYALETGWIFSWPDPGIAPMIDEATLTAGEAFDLLVFNALHGYYRQAIGELRTALEVMIVATGLHAADNKKLFDRWRAGEEVAVGNGLDFLRASGAGSALDAATAPRTVFGKNEDAWAKSLYGRLCRYSHSRAGYENADFWASNGPIHVPSALLVVEAEFREVLALCYVLLKIGWPAFMPTDGSTLALMVPGSPWVDLVPQVRSFLSAQIPPRTP
jgi:hypothetical protein